MTARLDATQAPRVCREFALASQLAVIAEHRSGAGLMPVSTGAQAMAVR
jgi:hypothetical protein